MLEALPNPRQRPEAPAKLKALADRHPELSNLIIGEEIRTPMGLFHIMNFRPPKPLVMNNWGLVVFTPANSTKQDHQVQQLVEAEYKFTAIENIIALRDFYISCGHDKKLFPVRYSADGMCSEESKVEGNCKRLGVSKDVCKGCGKSWIAGSYVEPKRCVPQTPQGWQIAHSNLLRSVIHSSGGVSTVAPLVTTPQGGVYRPKPANRK